MSAPLVSILVPVYNGERFLAECLDSILAQDWPAFEVLVSDDASTDSSAAIIEDYARRDARVRWWRNGSNLGMGENWNAAVRAARGEYLKFVLQDDTLLSPAAVRRLVEVMEQDPQISLAVTASQRIDDRSRRIRIRNCFGDSAVMDGRKVILRCLKQDLNCIGEPSLALFRKGTAERGFDSSLFQIIDLDMWFHLLERGKLAFIAEPLCAFREHPAQQTKVNEKSGVGLSEQRLFMLECAARPWVRAALAKPEAYLQLYRARECRGPRADAARAALVERIGHQALGYYYCRLKLLRPFQNLRRSLKKRLGKSDETQV
jgi:glycosyltransferase involved in cell wall biosynthesis